MKMGIYSVHIMGGLLMDPGHVLGSLRQHRKDPRLVPLLLLGHVLRGFRLLFLKVFSLFGQMRMAGKELKPLCHPCKDSCTLCFFNTIIRIPSDYFIELIVWRSVFTCWLFWLSSILFFFFF